MHHCKLCHAVLTFTAGAVLSTQLICASCREPQEIGIIADKSFEASEPPHSEKEAHEIIAFPREQVTSPTSAVPFIPSSHDPTILLHHVHQKYIQDYYASVMKSYFSRRWVPPTEVSSQSPPS